MVMAGRDALSVVQACAALWGPAHRVCTLTAVKPSPQHVQEPIEESWVSLLMSESITEEVLQWALEVEKSHLPDVFL